MKAIYIKEDLKPYLIEMPKPCIYDECYGKENGCCDDKYCVKLKYDSDLKFAKENAIPFDESCIDEVKKLIIYGDKTPLLDIGLSEFKPGGIYKIEALDDMIEVKLMCCSSGIMENCDRQCLNQGYKLVFLKKQEESQEEWIQSSKEKFTIKRK